MPIFHDKKVVQVRIPKTASTSMSYAITYDWDEPHNFGVSYKNMNYIHSSAIHLQQNLGEIKFNSYFKFSFVRNPFDWFMSKNKYFSTWRTISSRGIEVNDWFYGLEKVMDSRGGDYFNFNEYFPCENPVSCGAANCPAINGKECKCAGSMAQYKYIVDRHDKVMVDFVGKVESVEEHWQYVSEKIGRGVPNKLEFHNKREHSMTSYNEIYKDYKLADIIYRIFKKDCELFGYSIDDHKF